MKTLNLLYFTLFYFKTTATRRYDMQDLVQTWISNYKILETGKQDKNKEVGYKNGRIYLLVLDDL